MSEAVFEVTGPDGQIWRIYADGRISGFPDRCIVFNRIPLLVAIEANQVMRAESCPTSKPAEAGFAQG